MSGANQGLLPMLMQQGGAQGLAPMLMQGSIPNIAPGGFMPMPNEGLGQTMQGVMRRAPVLAGGSTAPQWRPYPVSDPRFVPRPTPGQFNIYGANYQHQPGHYSRYNLGLNGVPSYQNIAMPRPDVFQLQDFDRTKSNTPASTTTAPNKTTPWWDEENN